MQTQLQTLLNNTDVKAAIESVKHRHSMDCLRSELSHGMVPKRNSCYPSLPNHPQNVQLISKMPEEQLQMLRPHSQKILDMLINYLALAIFQGHYPKGDLSQQVRAKIVNGQVICHYCPVQTSKYDQPTQPLFEPLLTLLGCPDKKKREILDCCTVRDLIKQRFDLQNTLDDDTEQEIELLQTNNVSDLMRANLNNKIVMFNGRVQTSAQLVSLMEFKDFSTTLQTLLARCITDMQAVKTSKLPACLADYLLGRIQLPQEFITQLPNKKSAIKQLKLVFGVYPDEFPQIDNQVSVDQGALKQEAITLPQCLKAETGLPWIDQRIQQITYVFRDVKIGTKWELDGATLMIEENTTRQDVVRQLLE